MVAYSVLVANCVISLPMKRARVRKLVNYCEVPNETSTASVMTYVVRRFSPTMENCVLCFEHSEICLDLFH